MISIQVSEQLARLELADDHILRGYALGHLRDLLAELDRLRADNERLRKLAKTANETEPT